MASASLQQQLDSAAEKEAPQAISILRSVALGEQSSDPESVKVQLSALACLPISAFAEGRD